MKEACYGTENRGSALDYKKPAALFLALIISFSAFSQDRKNFTQQGPAGTAPGSSLSLAHASLPLGTQVRVTNTENGREITAIVSSRMPAGGNRIAVLSAGAAEALAFNGASPILIETITPPRLLAVPPPEGYTAPEYREPDMAPVSPGAPLIRIPVPERAVPQRAVPVPPPEPVPLAPVRPVPVIPVRPEPVPVIPVRPEPVPAAPVRPEPAPVRSVPVPSHPVRTVPEASGLYLIQAGSFTNEFGARSLYEQLKRAGFSPSYERLGAYIRVVCTGIDAGELPGMAVRLKELGIEEIWIRKE